MNHERLQGTARALLRSMPLLVLGLCAAGAVAYTVHWHQTNIRHRGRAPFTLTATPGSRSIAAGATTKYQILIHRKRYRGKIRLTAAGRGLGLLPDRASTRALNKITLKVHGQRVRLTVKTSLQDPPGRYSVKVRAVGGRYRGYLTVGLTIIAPAPAPFKIAGNFGPLWPGTAQAVNLALTNPNAQAISVRSLVVSIKQVTAPRATNHLPCSAVDFKVVPFSGIYPLRISAHASVHLSDLGVLAAKGPQLVMLNRPVNQNGCQGATVTLSYSGTATSP